MIGRASPMYSAAAGTITTDASRSPRESCIAQRHDDRRASAALAISGVNVVISDTANKPCGSWKNAYALM